MRQQPLFAAAGGWDIVKIKSYKEEVRGVMMETALKGYLVLNEDDELTEVNGGALPAIVIWGLGFLAGCVVEGVVEGLTGKSISDWIAEGVRRVKEQFAH